MKKIMIIGAAIVAAMVISCSGKKDKSLADDEIIALEQQLNDNAQSQSMIDHIDSLALMADDLTPSEAVKVLVTYMHVVKTATEAGKERVQLETMRKFVDVYDIVMGEHKSDMTDAFEAFARRNPNYNIIATASEYRENLRNYADGSAVEEDVIGGEQPKAETDSVKPAATVESDESSSSANEVFE